jgi:hypothetical protein
MAVLVVPQWTIGALIELEFRPEGRVRRRLIRQPEVGTVEFQIQ